MRWGGWGRERRGDERGSAVPFAFAREPEGDPDWLSVCLPARPPALPGRGLAESASVSAARRSAALPWLTLLNFPDHHSRAAAAAAAAP